MEWVRRAVGGLTAGAKGIAAIRSDGTVAGVVAYDLWTPAGCRMHLAMETPAATRTLLRAAFAYPFGELGLRLVTAAIPSHRGKAVRFATRLGFSEVHRTKDGWDEGSDIVHLELRREACRYLKPLNLKQKAA